MPLLGYEPVVVHSIVNTAGAVTHLDHGADRRGEVVHGGGRLGADDADRGQLVGAHESRSEVRERNPTDMTYF